MNEFIRMVKERRSVRIYKNREIPDDKLNTVLEAVQWSPSWGNTQCWEIVITKNIKIKEQLQKTLTSKNPATKSIMMAPVVLTLCARLESSGFYKKEPHTKFGDWFMFDVGIISQSIVLTAHSLGLGTVIVGSFDQNKAKDVLNVPETIEVVTIIPMGFPAKISKAPKRRDIKEFTHIEVF